MLLSAKMMKYRQVACYYKRELGRIRDATFRDEDSLRGFADDALKSPTSKILKQLENARKNARKKSR